MLFVFYTLLTWEIYCEAAAYSTRDWKFFFLLEKWVWCRHLLKCPREISFLGEFILSHYPDVIAILANWFLVLKGRLVEEARRSGKSLVGDVIAQREETSEFTS